MFNRIVLIYYYYYTMEKKKAKVTKKPTVKKTEPTQAPTIDKEKVEKLLTWLQNVIEKITENVEKRMEESSKKEESVKKKESTWSVSISTCLNFDNDGNLIIDDEPELPPVQVSLNNIKRKVVTTTLKAIIDEVVRCAVNWMPDLNDEEQRTLKSKMLWDISRHLTMEHLKVAILPAWAKEMIEKLMNK